MSNTTNMRPTILIGSDSFGQGENVEVGRVMAVELFFTLTQPDLTAEEKKAYNIVEDKKMPEAIVFYNSGVKLTMEGTPVAKELEELEDNGVEIFIDATSWDCYAPNDTAIPVVGEVVDTYIIQSLLMYKNRVITF